MFIGHQMSLPTACGCEHVPFQGYSSTTGFSTLCTFFPVWIIMCVLRWPAWLNDLFPIIAIDIYSVLMTLVGGRGKESMWLHMPSLLAFCLKCFTTSFAFEHNSIQYCVVLLKMFFERTDEFVVLTTIRTRKGSILKHFKRLERLLRRESFSIGFVAWKDNLCQALAVLGPLNTSWVWKTEVSKIDFFSSKH